MFKTTYIVAQKKINNLHITREGLVSVAWEKFLSESLWVFLSLLLISCCLMLFWITYVFEIKKH